MKTVSLASIRRRFVLLGFAVIVSVSVSVFTLSFLRLSSDYHAEGERFLGDAAGNLDERFLSTEAFLKALDVEEVDDSTLDAMKVSELVLCSDDGTILKVLRGQALQGQTFPPRLLNGGWTPSSHLSLPASPRLVLSVRKNGRWLVAGFESRALFSGFMGKRETDGSLLLVNDDGMVLASWGKDISTVGGMLPVFFVAPRNGEGLWGGTTLRSLSVNMGMGLHLVLVYPKAAVLIQATKTSLVWAAVLFGAMVPLLFFFGKTLYAITEVFLRSTRSLSDMADDIGSADNPLEAMPVMVSSLESFRTDDAPFEEYRRLLGAFERMMDVITEQSESLGSLYEEATAMELELRENNDELTHLNNNLADLMNLSRGVVASASLDATATVMVSNLKKCFSCEFAGLVAIVGGRPFLWGQEGAVPTDLSEDSMMDLMSRFVDQEDPEVSFESGRTRIYAPVRFMGRLAGFVMLVRSGKGDGRAIVEVLERFVLPLGGIFQAHELVREVRSSFHYLATRMQTLTESYHEETGSHLVRVGEYSALVAEHLGMSSEYVEDLRIYSQLHDIGKLKVPHGILSKPGSLTDEEFYEMRRHPDYAVDILGDSEWLEMARQIATTHHEKWDGSGYPRGLKGEDIPLCGRIVALADIYDALRDERGYKPAFSHEKAWDIILHGDGRVMPEHFDPAILEIFRVHHGVFADIYDRIKD